MAPLQLGSFVVIYNIFESIQVFINFYRYLLYFWLVRWSEKQADCMVLTVAFAQNILLPQVGALLASYVMKSWPESLGGN